MPNCSSMSGTRSGKSSSKFASHEDVASTRQYVGLAGADLRRRAFDLAMGLRSACQAALAGSRSARPLFRVETIRDIRALSYPELSQVQDGRVQRLGERRFRQVQGWQRKQSRGWESQ